MADFVDQKNEKENTYSPLELNLGVFFTAKSVGEKTSLSLNATRGAVKFKFTGFNDAGEKIVIEKKLLLNQLYLFTHMLKAIMADRLAIVKMYYEMGESGSIMYSKLPELDCELNTVYYAKESGYVSNGKLTISTVLVGGSERICITGYDKDGKSLRVVLVDESASSVIVRASKATVLDPIDLEFCRLLLEVDRATKSTFVYAGFDKIYQYLKYALPSSGEKKPFFNFFKKNDHAQIPQENRTIKDADEGEDLYD